MARILGTITAVILGSALCAGLVVMAGSAITLLEGERLGGVTGWAATKVAGRQVVVGGPVTIDWGTLTVVTAYGISVDNPDWASHPDLLDIATLRVGLDPASLLALDPAIPLLDVEQPKAFLNATRPAGPLGRAFSVRVERRPNRVSISMALSRCASSTDPLPTVTPVRGRFLPDSCLN